MGKVRPGLKRLANSRETPLSEAHCCSRFHTHGDSDWEASPHLEDPQPRALVTASRLAQYKLSGNAARSTGIHQHQRLPAMALNQPAHKPSACVPCHERKVRCDSAVVGVPCSRCISKSRDQHCTLVTRLHGSSNKRMRHNASDPRSWSGWHRREVSPSSNLDGTFASTNDATAATNNDRVLPRNSQDASTRDSTSRESRQPNAIPMAGPPRRTNSDSADAEYVEDAHVQTLYHMGDCNAGLPTPTSLASSARGHRVIEYFDRLNSLTMLGEVLGRRQRKRLIPIDLPGPESTSARDRELSRLEPADVSYLNGKRVYDLPRKTECHELLRLFFYHVYPYTPILDCAQLLKEYDSDSCSTFLLYSLFSNVVPYASNELLLRMGYGDRISAQKEFFSRARLLYDFGCEKAQLSLLQGSVLLSSFQFSFAPDKDFRFWFHNAIRVATQLGLHRQDLGDDLDPTTHKLCRRIWWVLYQRDVLFSLSGFENVRRIYDIEADTAPITEDDWESTVTTEQHSEILCPTTELQKHYFIENCKLAGLGAQFLRLFRSVGPPTSFDAAREFAGAISEWRRSLPEDLLIDRVATWSGANVWIIVLMAMAHRLDCIFYRSFREQSKGVNEEAVAWSHQRLLNSIFELDTVLNRAIVHDLVHLCPSSLIISTSNLLAFQIELALDPGATLTQKVTAKARIFAGLAYLRDVGEKWQTAKWTLRVVEWVTERTGLSLTHAEVGPNAQPWIVVPNLGSGLQNADQAFRANNSEQNLENPEGGLSDQWIQDFLGEGLFERLDDEFLNF